VNDPIAVIRCSEDLVEAFRLVKDRRKLSNDFVDGLAGLTRGHTDKVLGPTRAKNISAIPVSGTLDLYLQVFAVRLVMVDDVEFAQGMEAKWEARNASQYRSVANRVSKQLVERAKPLVMRDLGRLGGLKSASLPSARQVAQKGGKARAKKLTRQLRRDIARKAGLASAEAKRQRAATAVAALSPVATLALEPPREPCANQCP
jgi:hypothetical protein